MPMRRSLCIIDEFGKGTLSTDGVGLLCASLRHLAEQQPAPPKVIACTHFSEALNPSYLPRCLCRPVTPTDMSIPGPSTQSVALSFLNYPHNLDRWTSQKPTPSPTTCTGAPR